MTYLNTHSLYCLFQCADGLQIVAQESIKDIGFVITRSYVEQVAQQIDYFAGASEDRWPESKHNVYPAEAFIFSPYPAPKQLEKERYIMIARVMTRAAERLDIKIKCGALSRDESWGYVELAEIIK